ncbi:unnamed protein product, partial [Oikopleura dioica]
ALVISAKWKSRIEIQKRTGAARAKRRSERA